MVIYPTVTLVLCDVVSMDPTVSEWQAVPSLGSGSEEFHLYQIVIEVLT